VKVAGRSEDYRDKVRPHSQTGLFFNSPPCAISGSKFDLSATKTVQGFYYCFKFFLCFHFFRFCFWFCLGRGGFDLGILSHDLDFSSTTFFQKDENNFGGLRSRLKPSSAGGLKKSSGKSSGKTLGHAEDFHKVGNAF
jgi:hypothetical protein